jgi:DNA-binding response OmpR family regulator
MINKVLLVEDDKNAQEVISEFLEAYGFEVVTADSGEGGWEIYQKQKPDFLVSDVLLPKLNGFKLCEKIRQSPDGAALPIILISALYKTTKIQKDSREKYGLVDYLVKPVNLRELSSKISEVLGVTKEQLLAEKGRDLESKKAVETKNTPAAAEKAAPLAEYGSNGEITAGSTPLILLNLYKRRGTGVITFTNEGVTKKVFFREGEAIYATSTRLDETFGQLMLSDGILDKVKLDSALAKSKKEGLLLGKVLVGDGYIDEKILARYLVKEVHVRISELLEWSRGKYILQEGENFVEKIKRPPLPLLKLIHEKIQRGLLDEGF